VSHLVEQQQGKEGGETTSSPVASMSWEDGARTTPRMVPVTHAGHCAIAEPNSTPRLKRASPWWASTHEPSTIRLGLERALYPPAAKCGRGGERHREEA
jgi:hypothetical protein